VPLDDHEGGHVLDDPRQAAHVRQPPDRAERVHGRAPVDEHARLHVHVPADENVVAEDDVVFHVAIVGHVAARHKVAMVADARHAGVLGRAAMDRDAFAEDVVVADLDAGRLVAVRDVLRRPADAGIREKDVALADVRMAHEADAVVHDRAGANHHIGADVTERTDLHVVGQLSLGGNHR